MTECRPFLHLTPQTITIVFRQTIRNWWCCAAEIGQDAWNHSADWYGWQDRLFAFSCVFDCKDWWFAAAAPQTITSKTGHAGSPFEGICLVVSSAIFFMSRCVL